MPTLSNVFCANCKVFMKTKAIGVIVEETMDDGKPYKLWSADLFECPSCMTQIITRFATNPIAEHFEERYAALSKAYIAKGLFYIERAKIK